MFLFLLVASVIIYEVPYGSYGILSPGFFFGALYFSSSFPPSGFAWGSLSGLSAGLKLVFFYFYDLDYLVLPTCSSSNSDQSLTNSLSLFYYYYYVAFLISATFSFGNFILGTLPDFLATC